MKHYAPAEQSLKELFLTQRSKSRSQGHWPRLHLKGHFCWVLCQRWSLYLLRLKSYSQILKLTTDRKIDKQTDRQTNKQTDRQTDEQINRQDKNNMPPIIRSEGIKMNKIWINLMGMFSTFLTQWLYFPSAYKTTTMMQFPTDWLIDCLWYILM